MVAAALGAAIAVGVQTLASWHGGASSVGRTAGNVAQGAVGSAPPTAAVRYWTPARMDAAARVPVPAADHEHPAPKVPVRPERRVVRQAPVASAAPAPAPAAAEPWLTGDTTGHGLRWTHGGTVTAAIGKIFFTLGGEDYVCSGTLVTGKHPDLVLTAAHCVTGSTAAASRPQWATNWMFVPDFRDGLQPYGAYTARRFFVLPEWTEPKGGGEQYDIAFVQVTAATLAGKSDVAQPPPGLPMKFTDSQHAASPGRAYVFGYPSEPPYTGLYPNYCAGPAIASGEVVQTPCGMTAGDSGGPWIAGFSPRAGTGPVVAVSTYKYSDNLRLLYGAVLGPQAHALYERAVSSAR